MFSQVRNGPFIFVLFQRSPVVHLRQQPIFESVSPVNRIPSIPWQDAKPGWGYIDI